jgi:putative pyruvate formate lyase activating enzyme
VTVEVRRASVALFFKSLCGSRARQKRVPEALFRSPDSVLRAFLEAYLEGDGTRQGAYLAASTVSQELASGLLGLFLRLGLFPYFYATPRPIRQTIQGRTVRQAQTLYYVKCRYDAWKKRVTTGRVLWRDDIRAFLVPIRRIERQYYRGPVYNLEVGHTDHSYVANGMAVGNCQNFEISQLGQGRVISAGDLARMMVFLQEQGCHNINFVTPEHVVPQILEALPIAVELGLHLPIVYNTSAYDSMHSLRLLDGIVDIYMPDFKFWDREMSRLYLKAPDYPEVARRVIAEMHRQVGPLKLDERGLAKRGVLLRHLVMPGGVAGSEEIFRWIAREVSVHTYVNIMDQYYPAGRVGVDRRYDTINRRILPDEYAAAVRAAREAGLYRLDVRLPRHPRLVWIPA